MAIDGAVSRRGQAMMEMAIGMFVLLLVAMAVFSFSDIILSSMDQQNRIREEAGRKALNAWADPDVRVRFESAGDAERVELEPFAADYLFGDESVEVRNEVYIPAMSLQSSQE